MMYLRLGAVAAFLIILTADVAICAGATSGWDSLQGHKMVEVEVILDSEAVARGLTMDYVQTMVELRLLQAGITVSAGSGGILRVKVSTVFDHPTSAAHIDVAFVQLVYLTHPPFAVTTFAETWSTSALDLASASDFPQYLEDGLNRCIERFINRWLAANPR